MGKRILIADAGASSTKWLYIANTDIFSKDNEEWKRHALFFESEGINPVQQNIEKVLQVLEKVQASYKFHNLNAIFFFGAGCISYQSVLMKYHLKAAFGAVPHIEVAGDLTGASKALFGKADGIAAILGTGSNSGIYKEGKITMKIPALGYILGDEGSGAALGKRLLNGVYKRQLSPEIIQKFNEKYKFSLDDIIMNVYRRHRPAHFLASFSPFILDNIENPEIKNLVKDEFILFFERNILPYKDMAPLKTGFVGSIAYYYQDLLRETAKEFGVEITKIEKSSIWGISSYILQELQNQ